MKHINILSAIEAYRKLNKQLFRKFMFSYGIIIDDMKGIKDYEQRKLSARTQNHTCAA